MYITILLFPTASENWFLICKHTVTVGVKLERIVEDFHYSTHFRQRMFSPMTLNGGFRGFMELKEYKNSVQGMYECMG